MINKTLIYLLFILIAGSLSAQKTFTKDHPDWSYRKGTEMFNKQMYGLARFHLDDYYDNNPDRSLLMLNDARYFASACALELFNSNAEIRLLDFVVNTPEDSRIPDACYRLGISNFRSKDYAKVLEDFAKVDPYYLKEDEFCEYYFKKGYSQYATGKADEASNSFYEIKDKNSKFQVPAIYFYSHIAYEKRNFEAAMQGFKSISDDVLFAPIIPYYITHIYFLQEKYNDVVEYAPPMLDSVNPVRKPDLARIIGESYYRMAKFEEATPYLEEYVKSSPVVQREDYFQMGFCYHYSHRYKNAITVLTKVSDENDMISQNTNYLLGYCYLKTDDKKSARLAFDAAFKSGEDKRIKEESLLNYAKLTHELSISPFNEAILAFNQFIQTYPNSLFIDEAYAYLSKVYVSTKNYQEAIDALEKIQNITPDLEEAYQRVCFFRALELFTNSEFEDAIISFDKSLNNAKYNRLYMARSVFWKGESYYRLKRYDDAEREFNKFLVTTGSIDLGEFNTAHYNLGYCKFKKKEYKDAASWFRKYIDNMKEAQSKTVGDAFARTGDCYYGIRDYDNAVLYYTKAIDNGKASVDYAMFQKGFCFGLQKEHNQKIILLNQIVNDYPRSNYVDDALLEIGNSYFVIEENDMAVNSYQKLISDFPESSLVPRAYLQIGLVYYNTDKNQQAMESLKKVVENYPNTVESKEALASLKNVYLELNLVDEYFAYLKEKGGKIDISLTEQDSLNYTASYKVYMSADYNKASELFLKYVDKYKESGIFYVNASYYLAECYNQLSQHDKAVGYYKNVILKQSTEFTEPSLVKLSDWNYMKGNYQEAADYYTKLDQVAQYDNNRMMARAGRMHSYYKLNDLPEARKAAISLLSAGKIPDELFRVAHFIIGKDAFANNSLEEAADEFNLISGECKTIEQAEAKYLVALIYFRQTQPELAEKEIFDFVKKNTPHQYWLAKAFILLADIYLQRNDSYQAKATLQSVLDNYKNKTDGIHDEAMLKLKAIADAEAKSQNEQNEVPQMEINLDNSKNE